MSRTWILYNKPDEPNVTHAGLLLALGLHGHLRVLTITDIFQYYSQVLFCIFRHPITSYLFSLLFCLLYSHISFSSKKTANCPFESMIFCCTHMVYVICIFSCVTPNCVFVVLWFCDEHTCDHQTLAFFCLLLSVDF